MIFADVPSGEAVFVDANVFVYHFQPHSIYGRACSELLERIERTELQGITSVHVLAELAHRLMALEAFAEYGWPYTGIAQRLKRHPAKVRRLKRFRQAIEEIPAFGIQILPLQAQIIASGAAVSQETGLLSNDALLVALMRQHEITYLASHDADFDHVPDLRRCAPA